jgi:hypothetical protein
VILQNRLSTFIISTEIYVYTHTGSRTSRTRRPQGTYCLDSMIRIKSFHFIQIRFSTFFEISVLITHFLMYSCKSSICAICLVLLSLSTKQLMILHLSLNISVSGSPRFEHSYPFTFWWQFFETSYRHACNQREAPEGARSVYLLLNLSQTSILLGKLMRLSHQKNKIRLRRKLGAKASGGRCCGCVVTH